MFLFLYIFLKIFSSLIYFVFGVFLCFLKIELLPHFWSKIKKTSYIVSFRNVSSKTLRSQTFLCLPFFVFVIEKKTYKNYFWHSTVIFKNIKKFLIWLLRALDYLFLNKTIQVVVLILDQKWGKCLILKLIDTTELFRRANLFLGYRFTPASPPLEVPVRVRLWNFASPCTIVYRIH